MMLDFASRRQTPEAGVKRSHKKSRKKYSRSGISSAGDDFLKGLINTQIAYTRTELLANPHAVVNRVPEVVSQFAVEPVGVH